MASQDVREYSVSLSDDLLSKLRQGARKPNESSAPTFQSSSPNFTIRYSVAPDLLKRDNCELNLRKYIRGEYIVEDASLGSERELGTGNVEHDPSAFASRSSGPSFRGPGTGAQEHECVLIFNEKLQKYELHALHLNFQVAPVLKTRNRASSRESYAVLREQPSEDAKNSSASLQKANSKVSAQHVTGTQTTPTNSASAAYIPKTSTRARLPTRRKLPNSKPPMSSRNTVESSPSSSPFLSLSQPSNNPSASNHSANVSNTSSVVASCDVSASNSVTSTCLPSLANNPSLDLQQSFGDESGFDDSFDDLADELADEMMEDEEEIDIQPSKSMGTAGVAAQDDDIISEEE